MLSAAEITRAGSDPPVKRTLLILKLVTLLTMTADTVQQNKRCTTFESEEDASGNLRARKL